MHSQPSLAAKKSSLVLKGRVRSFCGPVNGPKGGIRKTQCHASCNIGFNKKANTARKRREKYRGSAEIASALLSRGDEEVSEDDGDSGPHQVPIREFNKLMSSVNVLSQEQQWDQYDSIGSLSCSSGRAESPGAREEH